MLSFNAIRAISFSVLLVQANPTSLSSGLAVRDGEVTCGGAPDAVWVGFVLMYWPTLIFAFSSLSDCQSLVDSTWVDLNYGRICSVGGSSAFNPICSPGNCRNMTVFITIRLLMCLISRLRICRRGQADWWTGSRCCKTYSWLWRRRQKFGQWYYVSARRWWRRISCLFVHWLWLQWLLVGTDYSEYYWDVY